MNRRQLFSIFPAAAAGCLGCMTAARCAAQAETQTATHSPAEKSDMTWEGVFRFAFQRNFIPVMKGLAGQIGEEKLVQLVRDTVSERARKGMEASPIPKRDMATWIGHMKTFPPLFQHALVYDVIEETPQALEIRVTQCLWAKVFREENAGAIGYAAICHPDFAVASGFSPKLKLIRTKTLMQGHEYCNHRYVMES